MSKSHDAVLQHVRGLLARGAEFTISVNPNSRHLVAKMPGSNLDLVEGPDGNGCMNVVTLPDGSQTCADPVSDDEQ